LTDINYYQGISFPFRINSRGGIASSKLQPNILDRINESIQQIVLTYPGERIMEPEFGCDVKKYLFEDRDSPIVKSQIAFSVKKAIEKWEKRVQVMDISVYSAEEWEKRTSSGEYTMSDSAVIVEIEIYVYKYAIADTVIVEVV
jgi:phage baseplate assembly protein W